VYILFLLSKIDILNFQGVNQISTRYYYSRCKVYMIIHFLFKDKILIYFNGGIHSKVKDYQYRITRAFLNKNIENEVATIKYCNNNFSKEELYVFYYTMYDYTTGRFSEKFSDCLACLIIKELPDDIVCEINESIVIFYNSHYIDLIREMVKKSCEYNKPKFLLKILNTYPTYNIDHNTLKFICETFTEENVLTQLNKHLYLVNENNYNQLLTIGCKRGFKNFVLKLLEYKPNYKLQSPLYFSEKTALEYAKENNLDEIFEIIKNRLKTQDEKYLQLMK